MAKVDNIVIYRPKEGRENDLLALVKKHWTAVRAAGLATDEPARVWRASDKRSGKVSFVERFAWADEAASSKAHHNAKVQAVWGPMDEVLEDMTILVVEDVSGRPPARRAKAPARSAKRAPAKRRAAARTKKAAPKTRPKTKATAKRPTARKAGRRSASRKKARR